MIQPISEKNNNTLPLAAVDTANETKNTCKALWDIDLIRKYNVTGSRYTSYPTALKFDDRYTEDNWLKATQNVSSGRSSIYVHIPFCDTICYYCGCNKIITANHAHAGTYLEYLKQEISMKAAHIPATTEVELIHLGGGTPTYFSDEQLEELMAHLKRHFQFIKTGLECAIEIHPQSVTPERLKNLRRIGFNRVSLGVQDFNPAVQRAVNRYNSKQEVRKLIETLQELDYESCSIDLIYGLPLQTSESFARTLADVIELSPDRISLFNYAHMPHLFKTQKQINANELPEPQEKLNILHNSIASLTEQGYDFIGMDHFAKHDDELSLAQRNGKLHRNFQGYSTNNSPVLHAFGLSAISTIDEHYVQNHKRLDAYYSDIDHNKLPISKGFTLDQDDLIRKDVINQLMCQYKLDYAALNAKFDIEFDQYFHDILPALTALEEDGLIQRDSHTLSVALKGRLLIRSVCKLFDQYATPDNEANQKYSRII